MKYLSRFGTSWSFLALAALVLGMTWEAVFAASSPVPMLEQRSNQIIQSLKANRAILKTNPQVIGQAVRQYLLPSVDVRGMARSVLGRNAWNKATRSEQAEFTKLFTNLVIRTYTRPLMQYTDEKVKFFPVAAQSNPKFARVNSVIIRPSGQTIPLNYSMVNTDGSWKVYDLSVEGVSLLQSFRTQFADVLHQSSMQVLIEKLRHPQKLKAA